MFSWWLRPLDNSVSSSPHPDEVACVLDTITEILAVSADIIGRHAKEGNSFLPIATLDRVSTLSESLWKEILRLPLSSTPRLQKSLAIYKLILVNIQQVLDLSDVLGISDEMINRRLDDFVFQFREALDLLQVKGPFDAHRCPPNSTDFLQGPELHHIVIFRRNFSVGINRPVFHGLVVREQSACCFLFLVAQIMCLTLHILLQHELEIL